MFTTEDHEDREEHIPILAIDSLRRVSSESIYELRVYADAFCSGAGRDWLLFVLSNELVRRNVPGAEPGMLWIGLESWLCEDVCQFATELDILRGNPIREDAGVFVDQVFQQVFSEVKSRLRVLNEIYRRTTTC